MMNTTMNDNLHITAVERSSSGWTVTTESLLAGMPIAGRFEVLPEDSYEVYFEPASGGTIGYSDDDEFIILTDEAKTVTVDVDVFFEAAKEARLFAVKAVVRLERDIENVTADLISQMVA